MSNAKARFEVADTVTNGHDDLTVHLPDGRKYLLKDIFTCGDFDLLKTEGEWALYHDKKNSQSRLFLYHVCSKGQPLFVYTKGRNLKGEKLGFSSTDVPPEYIACANCGAKVPDELCQMATLMNL